MKKNNVIKEKKAMLEVLEVIMDRLDDERRYISQSFEKVGEEQKKDENGNPMTDDVGEPIMKNVYDYVDIKPEDMSEDTRIKLDAIDKIQTALEKLI